MTELNYNKNEDFSTDVVRQPSLVIMFITKHTEKMKTQEG